MVESVQDDLDIEITSVPQGDHVPKAERNNRTIGERIHAAFHRLPYQMIPKVMMRALAKVATRQLNFLSGAASQYKRGRFVVPISWVLGGRYLPLLLQDTLLLVLHAPQHCPSYIGTVGITITYFLPLLSLVKNKLPLLYWDRIRHLFFLTTGLSVK